MALRIWLSLCKLVQKQTYSCLSTNYGIWCAFIGLCVIVVSAFHFGEVALQWSMIRYAGRFQFIRQYDNIAGKSFQYRLCLPQPIDIVYTWVNGSDPELISKLNSVKNELRKELNVTSGKLYASSKWRDKLINLDKYKWKNAIICPVPNCVPAYKLAVSGLPNGISISELISIDVKFSSVSEIEVWDDDLGILFVTLNSREKVHVLMNSTLIYRKHKLNVTEVFYTSTIKTGHKKIDNALMLYYVVRSDTAKTIQQDVESKLPKSVKSVTVHYQQDLGVVHLKDKKYAATLKALAKKNFTINQRKARFFPMTYIWKPIFLSLDTEDEDLSSNRFADNNELKFSLRSVEKYAPWVRNIFIVTNGQIPSWLNLDHPRISIVTHEEIFTNKSHLPTFSSPAIESHIHRIPGLSQKFIYMNDDVFFGTEVWPDDFYTHSKGHKIFLSWAVPNCHEGCPSSWLSDKYCDKSCNVSACDWDGGDCLGTNAKTNWQLQAMQSSGLYQHNLGEYCSSGCAPNWIGDRYCDGNCNTPTCGFDAGDCGVKNFKMLYGVSFSKEVFQKKKTTINIPIGTYAMFINLTNVFDTVIEGNFDDKPVMRSAVFAKKLKILSLTFYKNFSLTSIPFQVLGYKSANQTGKSVLFFNVTVNTLLLPVIPTLNAQKITTTTITYPDKLYNENDYQYVSQNLSSHQLLYFPTDIANLSLPDYLSEKLSLLEEEYVDGEITELGYNRSKGSMYQEYLKHVQSQYETRKLLWNMQNSPPNHELTNPYTSFFSFLPWEKNGIMRGLSDLYRRRDIMNDYITERVQKRHLLDAFSSSLLHVSRIYNREFGYKSRKVPAHMPHMVDREVIYEMQKRFLKYFEATSSHKVRHPQDMQFAFSFNYYLIGVKGPANLSSVFDDVDTDHSGTLSDRELRSLAAILYELPLNLKAIEDIEGKFKNCSKRIKRMQQVVNNQENYYNPSMPLVTKALFLNCHEIWRKTNVSANNKQRYKHEIVGEDDVTFKMIRNNISYVLYQLDWVRKNRRKFICLNDDLDHAREETKMIRNVLKDFYESLFPIPSQFELPSKYRNTFLHKEDLELFLQLEKRKGKTINIFFMLLVLLLFLFFYRRKLYFVCKKFARFLSGVRGYYRFGEGVRNI